MPPHGEVSDTLPHCIISHTSIKLCAVVAVEVVTIDVEDRMIHCIHMLYTQVGAFFRDYVSGGVVLRLVFWLVIPVSHGIIIPFTFFSFVPSW